MTSVTAAWPFIKWSIDIIDPLPEALGKVKFLDNTDNGKQFKEGVFLQFCKRQNQTSFYLRIPSLGQRIIKSHKQRNSNGIGEKTRKDTQMVGRRTPLSPLGPQNQPKKE
nr:hypothetical protein [Tanacetum cinerariifolium]